jgi:hypothetical protein
MGKASALHLNQGSTRPSLGRLARSGDDVATTPADAPIRRRSSRPVEPSMLVPGQLDEEGF